MKTTTLAIWAALAASVYATTWHETTVKDPISGGDTKVSAIASYGGYIYKWPSKYDGIYWPYTDAAYIRFSPISGYIAFGSDFEKISKEEKTRVAAFLKENFHKETPPKTQDEKLDWLARVYEARGADDGFWLTYHCLRAYLSRTDEKTSKQHREQAVKVATRLVATLKPSENMAKVIFILGSYTHMLGRREESGKWFTQLKALKWENANPDAAPSPDIVEYFSQLAESVQSGAYVK